MDVTPRKCEKIKTFANFTNKSCREIALECGVGKSTVARLMKQHAQTGSLSPQRVLDDVVESQKLLYGWTDC